MGPPVSGTVSDPGPGPVLVRLGGLVAGTGTSTGAESEQRGVEYEENYRNSEQQQQEQQPQEEEEGEEPEKSPISVEQQHAEAEHDWVDAVSEEEQQQQHPAAEPELEEEPEPAARLSWKEMADDIDLEIAMGKMSKYNNGADGDADAAAGSGLGVGVVVAPAPRDVDGEHQINTDSAASAEVVVTDDVEVRPEDDTDAKEERLLQQKEILTHRLKQLEKRLFYLRAERERARNTMPKGWGLYIAKAPDGTNKWPTIYWGRVDKEEQGIEEADLPKAAAKSLEAIEWKFIAARDASEKAEKEANKDRSLLTKLLPPIPGKQDEEPDLEAGHGDPEPGTSSSPQDPDNVIDLERGTSGSGENSLSHLRQEVKI